jgi:cobalamin biosynthesis protein CobT
VFRAGAREKRDKTHARLCDRREADLEKSREKNVASYEKALKTFDAGPICADADVFGKAARRDLKRRVEAYLVPLAPSRREDGLKKDLERYFCGLGLAQLKPEKFTFTSKTRPREENIEFLKAALFEVYRMVQVGKLSLRTEAAVPEASRRALPLLGAKSLERIEFETKDLASAEELQALVEKRKRARDEEAANVKAKAKAKPKKPRRRDYSDDDDDDEDDDEDDDDDEEEDEEEDEDGGSFSDGESDSEDLEPNNDQIALVGRYYEDESEDKEAWGVFSVDYDGECKMIVAFIYLLENGEPSSVTDCDWIDADELLEASWAKWRDGEPGRLSLSKRA